MKKQLYAYSELTGDVLEIGPPSGDFAALRDLGDTMATNRDSLIVFVDKPGLQPWETSND